MSSLSDKVEMTSSDHPSGTDRVAEVMARHGGFDGAVNIQGDEPMIDPQVIDKVAEALQDAPMTTAATPIRTVEDYQSPHCEQSDLESSLRSDLLFSKNDSVRS